MDIETGGSAPPPGDSGLAAPDLRKPRRAGEVVAVALRLYRRYPLLFYVLAAGVIAPYDLIVLVTAHVGPYGHRGLHGGTPLLLELIDVVLIGPLISALHIHAVALAGEGIRPRLAQVAQRGVQVLPVVVAAQIMATLGEWLGLLAFVIPGIVLFFRWFVVAQAAAVEHEGWLPALRRSRELTAGNYGHIFAFILLVALLTFVPSLLADIAVTGNDTRAGAFIAGVAVHSFAASLGALTTAVLYFDLVARKTSQAGNNRL